MSVIMGNNCLKLDTLGARGFSYAVSSFSYFRFPLSLRQGLQSELSLGRGKKTSGTQGKSWVTAVEIKEILHLFQ